MVSVKALFLAILMSKNEEYTTAIMTLVNNDKINEIEFEGYRQQVRTDENVMVLSLMSKLASNENMKIELLHLFEEVQTSAARTNKPEIVNLLIG